MNTKDYKPFYFIQNLSKLTARISQSRDVKKGEKVIREFKYELEAKNCLAQYDSYKRVTRAVLRDLAFFEAAFVFQGRLVPETAYISIFIDGRSIAASSLLSKKDYMPYISQFYKDGYSIKSCFVQKPNGENYFNVYLNK